MKFLLVVALAIVACSARPDIGLTYKTTGTYAPSRTYIPSAGGAHVTYHESHGVVPGSSSVTYHESASSSHGVHGDSIHVPSTHYEVPTVVHGVHHSGSAGAGSFEYGSGSYGSGSYGSGNYGSGSYGSGSYGSYGSHGGAVHSNVITKTNIHHVSGPSTVSRHAFFYDSGDEGAVSTTRIHVPVAPTKKNVNLVFVKAPSYGHNTKIIAPQQQSEEKTKVVVLVKNPDVDQVVTLPQLAPAKPSKPEVLFVKYNNPQEAEHKIAATLNGARGAAHYANELGSEGGLVSSIARSESQHTVGITVDKYVNDAAEAEYEAAGGSHEYVHHGGDYHHGSAGVHHVTHGVLGEVQHFNHGSDASGVHHVNHGSTSGHYGGVNTFVSGYPTHSTTVVKKTYNYGAPSTVYSSGSHYAENHPGYSYKK